jgi:HK97 family phage major capsid protein
VPFNSVISRPDAAALIPEEVVTEVIQAAAAESAALSLFRQVNMGTKVSTLPVLSALAQAYFVQGDTGLKQTTEQQWSGITLEAEEIAAIVPVPEAVVDDSAIDIWAEVQQGLAEAVGHTLDAAVFMGTDKPATWAQAIVPAAITAGNAAEAGTSTAAEGGIVGDIDAALDAVEADGYDPTGIAAKRSLRGLLRKARDSNGQRLADLSGGTVEGLPVAYVGGGVFDATTLAVTGDFRLAVIGLRADFSYKILDQAVLTDAAGLVIANLPQQDMLAMRVTFRAAFATAAPVTRPDGAAGTPYPFAVLQDAVPPAARSSRKGS